MEELKLTKWLHYKVENGICILMLDCGEEAKQNLLSRQALEELNRVLDANLSNKPKAMIICSSKSESFCAGMDIEEIREIIKKPEEIKELLKRAEMILMKIHRAPYTIIAAISGECLGGGLELAMACKFRLATNNSQFGLPETALGIIPGFGGTQFLPKLVGLEKALEMITNGQKRISTREAHRLGLIDGEYEHYLELMGGALDIAQSSHFMNSFRKKHWLERVPVLGKKLILAGARKRALKETKGAYPAVFKAIDAVEASGGSLEKGLDKEHDLFGELIKTPQAKNLISIYFLKKDARAMKWVDAPDELPPRRVAVIGAGLMGRKIAYSLISKDIPVMLHDTNIKAVHDAVIFIESALGREKNRGYNNFQEIEEKRNLLMVSWGDDLSPIAGADFVIEAIIENLEIKQKLLKMVESTVAESAVIATNTSAILPSDIASGMTLKNRFCAMHFFNHPYQLMDLVEIAGTANTDKKTLMKTLALTKAMNKTPVVAEKECAGLIVNRVVTQYITDALYYLERTRIDPWMLDYFFEQHGMAMGPFKMLDLIGFDTGAHVMKVMGGYYKTLPTEKLQKMDIARHKDLLGEKTGQGFYIWKNGKAIAPNKKALARLGLPSRNDLEAEETASVMKTLMVSHLVKEAKKIYEEKVCRSENMIDLSVILGTGMAPNRRGLLGGVPVDEE